MKTTLTAAACLLATTFSLPAIADQTQDKKALLLEWMQGHFDSEQQASADADFFNIHLNMTQIWTEHQSTWLYVEQAAVTHLQAPYRQRVYEVSAISDTEFSSKVYTFENPKSYAGDYKKPQPLANLTPDDLTIKQGCTVYLTWNESTSAFIGSTKEDECKSQLRGASYATSEVMVTADKILSWDRGFDADGKQVWGAVKGGYEFIKK
ncbi:chromophore lyase CpcT/CpeT [Shewanella maritima]|uniref:chromophore lyase CpcT/CpeT n=1 Tax=Shewanella maritima TaxID=2520507 RepID=UPI0037363BC1